jgi:hypothetical protein
MNKKIIDMNKISNIRKTVFTWIACMLLVVGGSLSSCNYLNIDHYTTDDLKMDSIFSSKRFIEAYMWGAATKFYDEGALLGYPYTPGPMATDEAFCLYNAGEFNGMAYVQGEINANNLGQFAGNWKRWYQIIRQCNTIFSRIDEASDWTINERNRILGYTRFIRAYAYYNLLMNFGPVILLDDEVVENNEDISYYDRPRDLYDDCVEYICNEFEESADYLDIKANSVVDFGLPTKGAAYGLIARLRLQHASDLFNGGRYARLYYGTWTRKTDGKNYIQQQHDPSRWAVAAAAAKRVIDMTDVGVKMYSLHTIGRNSLSRQLPTNITEDIDPDFYKPWLEGGAGDIDPFLSYHEMFNGETPMNVNPEIIWGRYSSNTTNYTRHSFPYTGNGYNGVCVTQKVVDTYNMIDGRPINNSSVEYPYSESGFTSLREDISSEYWLAAGVHNMYVNREARFYASIGFSECVWQMISLNEATQRNQVVTYYTDSSNGKDGAETPTNYPITGYVIKKYIHPLDSWGSTSSRQVGKSYPIIRYAEILLAYAEALNQLGSGSYTVTMGDQSQIYFRNTDEIKWAINQVRHRAGLPGLSDANMADAGKILEMIKRERMLEFLFENQRYFDVRRWGDYEVSESEPIKGMNTMAPKDSYYQRVTPASVRVGNRVVDRKMIFLPISQVELKRLPSFDQNPGW